MIVAYEAGHRKTMTETCAMIEEPTTACVDPANIVYGKKLAERDSVTPPTQGFDDWASRTKSIFAVESTFNLSSLYVYVTILGIVSWIAKLRTMRPIFYIGWHKKYAAYLNFFSTLCSAMNGSDFDAAEFQVDNELVTGSDENTTM